MQRTLNKDSAADGLTDEFGGKDKRPRHARTRDQYDMNGQSSDSEQDRYDDNGRLIEGRDKRDHFRRRGRGRTENMRADYDK